MLISKFDLYKTEWLDLVFEKRNKNYGAYELRQSYAQTMVKAISVTVFASLAAAVVFNFAYRNQVSTEVTEHRTEINLKKLKDVVLPPPPKNIDEVKQVKPASAKQVPDVATTVIPTKITSDPVTAVDPPVNANITTAIGSVESKGENKGDNVPVNTAPAGTGDGMGSKVETNPNGVFDFAEVSPEPNGGMAGWSKFLQRNLRYPDTEAQGRVFVSFIVERDGSLSNIKVMKGVSPELDAEALRVLKMAPKWKPGMQNHEPVRVQYNIPIVFQLN